MFNVLVIVSECLARVAWGTHFVSVVINCILKFVQAREGSVPDSNTWMNVRIKM